MNINSILQNWKIMIWVMAFVVFIATYIIKLPIKLLTSRISDDKQIKVGNKVIYVRKLVNTIILLIPVALGILGELLYSKFILHEAFDVFQGITCGAYSISMYGLVERFIGVKFTAEEKQEAKASQEIVKELQEIASDGEVTPDEVQEFINKHLQ